MNALYSSIKFVFIQLVRNGPTPTQQNLGN
jgi:hypothetical protein